jgi:hypothetical protein
MGLKRRLEIKQKGRRREIRLAGLGSTLMLVNGCPVQALALDGTILGAMTPGTSSKGRLLLLFPIGAF